MKESDFVKGKWYRSNQFSNISAIKFKKTSNEGLMSCEQIFLKPKILEQYDITWSKEVYPLESFKEVSIEELKEYIPIGHEDYEKIENFKGVFPSQGCSENTPQLFNYMVNELGAINGNRIYDSSKSYLKWYKKGNVRCYIFLENKSLNVGYYKQLEVEELIKTNKNENKNSTTEVCGTSSEIKQSIGKGTIAMGCSRQQTSIRSRLVGNIARSIETTTNSISSKICPKIGQRRNS